MFIYGLICHKLTNSLIFTVSKLCESQFNLVIIHIDSKTSKKEYLEIFEKLSVYSNVKFIEFNRIDVKWGGVSQIFAMLELMKEALKYDFKYFSFISGDDIPLMSNKQLEKTLLESHNNHIQYIGICEKHDAKDRVQYKYPDYFFTKNRSLFTKLKIIIFLKIFKKYNKIKYSFPRLYKGNTWFTVTDQVVQYVIDYVNENPDYIEAFRYSLCADEVFFHTIIFNSIYRSSVYNLGKGLNDCEMSLRYIDWETGPEFPKLLDNSDFNKLMNSNALFARKINPSLSLLEIEQFYNRIVSSKSV